MSAYFSGAREARRFTEFDYAPTPPGFNEFVPNKEASRAVAEALGLRVPACLGRFGSVADIDLAGMPGRFVLKATNLSSKQGVYLLTVVGPDAFSDRFTRRTFSTAEIQQHLAGKLAKRKGSENAPILAEEWVVGENGADQVPFDYKMYTFDGTVEFVLQTNRNLKPTGLAFFGHGFEPLEEHCVVKVRDNVQRMAPVRPANWQHMLDAASSVSRHLDTPFISVDTYTTGSDVVIGELTPRPGGPYHGMWQFSDVFDGELGTYYKQAYRRRGLSIPIVTGLPPVLTKRDEEEGKVRRFARAAWAALRSPASRR
ncbi:MAG: hypothetical protein JNL14_16000 [Devosia sp.]|uniref:ATP-grasp fold amidoligase family protein n=1 Tax=Devosia sp. TaxID=1871048 RepID=UPI001A491609|nr:ATP-grasp fold amidoligase family protein [Devosia sp.]MBL8599236.1 hypothetical protein [Devosia sp.]